MMIYDKDNNNRMQVTQEEAPKQIINRSALVIPAADMMNNEPCLNHEDDDVSLRHSTKIKMQFKKKSMDESLNRPLRQMLGSISPGSSCRRKRSSNKKFPCQEESSLLQSKTTKSSRPKMEGHQSSSLRNVKRSRSPRVIRKSSSFHSYLRNLASTKGEELDSIDEDLSESFKVAMQEQQQAKTKTSPRISSSRRKQIQEQQQKNDDNPPPPLKEGKKSRSFEDFKKALKQQVRRRRHIKQSMLATTNRKVKSAPDTTTIMQNYDAVTTTMDEESSSKVVNTTMENASWDNITIPMSRTRKTTTVLKNPSASRSFLLSNNNNINRSRSMPMTTSSSSSRGDPRWSTPKTGIAPIASSTAGTLRQHDSFLRQPVRRSSGTRSDTTASTIADAADVAAAASSIMRQPVRRLSDTMSERTAAAAAGAAAASSMPPKPERRPSVTRSERTASVAATVAAAATATTMLASCDE